MVWTQNTSGAYPVMPASSEISPLSDRSGAIVSLRSATLPPLQTFRYERLSLDWLTTQSGLILFFTAILAYYYWRLRIANAHTQTQAQAVHRANQELSLALKQEVLLQREIHHRVKNNLQVIISLLERQKDEVTDPATRSSLDAMVNRIYSVAAIHNLMCRQEGKEVGDLQAYARVLCEHFTELAGAHRPRFSLELGPHAFKPETLMPLGIMLNELLTNSLKYGTVSGRPLSIRIWLEVVQDCYCLHYADNGPGFPGGILTDRVGGLGSYLLQCMSRQLQGGVETTNDGGAVTRIYFKAKPIRERPWREHDDVPTRDLLLVQS